MRPAILLMLAAALSPAIGHAAGLDCRSAKTAAEHMICSNPDLRSADAALAKHYATVRGAVTLFKPLAAHLLASQRAWLAERDRCRDADCYGARIKARDAQLAALAANVSDPNPTLFNLQPVWLEGSWRVEPATPPPQPGQGDDVETAGTTWTFKPGERCDSGGCSDFGLEPKTLADIPGGNRMSDELHLPATTHFYTAMLNGRAVYGLVEKTDGSLVAVSDACEKGGSPCWTVQQPWRPIDGAIHRPPPL